MRTREEIEADFNRAVSQAQELEEIAGELSRIANTHVANALALLEKSWKGENAALFNSKGKLLTEDMFETADDLIQAARNIRSTADVVYRAEKKSVSLV